jgi:hypothetical protein
MPMQVPFWQIATGVLSRGPGFGSDCRHGRCTCIKGSLEPSRTGLGPSRAGDLVGVSGDPGNGRIGIRPDTGVCGRSLVAGSDGKVAG